jgi:hypothetical protein
MPQGDKSAYTDKQKRKAAHIADGYEERGVPEKEAEARAWAAVNKDSGGGNMSGPIRMRLRTRAVSRRLGVARRRNLRLRRRVGRPGGRRLGKAGAHH